MAVFAAYAQTSASGLSGGASGVLGGVAQGSATQASKGTGDGAVALIASPPVVSGSPLRDLDYIYGRKLVLAGSLGGSIRDDGAPRNDSLGTGSLISYRVKRGDTLSGIGRDFGISVQTIIDANPQVRARALQVGQELKILPVSGVAYTMGEGETIESIASLFGLQPSQIKEFNRSVDFAVLPPGTVIIIPGARTAVAQTKSRSVLPNLAGYFALPVQGFNWGKLHERNAVDIANACGTPVLASAEGLVTDMGEGWNSGYGSFVLIEHPNGTKSRYAHLKSISVFLGDYVRQGAIVGAIGNTGNVHGPTGCHLHFEVEGAQNPFVK